MALGSIELGNLFGKNPTAGFASGFSYNPSNMVRFGQNVGAADPNLRYAGTAGGILGGLMSGLRAYSGVRGGMEEEAQREAYKQQMGLINDRLAQGDYAGASSAISAINPEYGAQLAMAGAGMNRQDRLVAEERAWKEKVAKMGFDRNMALKQARASGNNEAILKSAQDGINRLSEIASSGKIGKFNNKAGGLFARESEIGKRDAALSTLIPLTNAIAKASGGSGINTLGEMMAYLGIPENSTSESIAGALPIIASKLGLQYTPLAPSNKKTSADAFGNRQEYANKYGLE